LSDGGPIEFDGFYALFIKLKPSDRRGALAMIGD
jgi:hypothetical protein